MTLDDAKQKLRAVYSDPEIPEAILILVQAKIENYQTRLSSRGGKGDFFTRGMDLIEASGAVMALEELYNHFRLLPEDKPDSPPDDEQA